MSKNIDWSILINNHLDDNYSEPVISDYEKGYNAGINSVTNNSNISDYEKGFIKGREDQLSKINKDNKYNYRGRGKSNHRGRRKN